MRFFLTVFSLEEYIKKREGFVSNSSSCSFVIPKNKITIDQFLKAKHYLVEEEGDKGEMYLDTTGWNCYEKGDFYGFETSLDNFCMIRLVKSMGITGKDFQDVYHSNGYDIEWRKHFEKTYGVKLTVR